MLKIDNDKEKVSECFGVSQDRATAILEAIEETRNPEVCTHKISGIMAYVNNKLAPMTEGEILYLGFEAGCAIGSLRVLHDLDLEEQIKHIGQRQTKLRC